MFDSKKVKINKMKCLEKVDNSIVISDLESGKEIYIVNSKDDSMYRLTFSKINKSSFKVIMDFTDNEDSKEAKLLNGKMSILISKFIISLYYKNKKLYIITSDMFKFYE